MDSPHHTAALLSEAFAEPILRELHAILSEKLALPTKARAMDSAPMDGTDILAYNPVTGWYRTRYESGEWPFADWYKGRPSDPGIWYPHPTCWMPLPDESGEIDEEPTPSPAGLRAMAAQLVKLPVREMAHSDHPMRHWDRTCPACKAQAAHPDEFDLDDYIAEQKAANLLRVAPLTRWKP